MRLPSSRFLELIIAASVVVISLASLFVALYQGRVMERTMKASVLPVVEYTTGNYDIDLDEPRITMTLSNNGLGPATIKQVLFRYEGVEFTSPGHLLALCCVPGADNVEEAQAILRTAAFPVITSVLRNRVLTPGQTLPMLSMPDQDLGELGAGVWAELDTARFDVEVEVCYCSVFDDCWRTRYPDAVRTPVERCIRREDQE